MKMVERKNTLINKCEDNFGTSKAEMVGTLNTVPAEMISSSSSGYAEKACRSAAAPEMIEKSVRCNDTERASQKCKICT